jgi:hypothetical protein
MNDSKLYGSKDSPSLICVSLVHGCNFYLLLSFSNISTLPHFQKIY